MSSSRAGQSGVSNGVSLFHAIIVDTPTHASGSVALFAPEGPVGVALGYIHAGDVLSGSPVSGVMFSQMALTGLRVPGGSGSDVPTGGPALAEAPPVGGHAVALEGFVVTVGFTFGNEASGYVVGGTGLTGAVSLTSGLS
jgi:hypothetical protein